MPVAKIILNALHAHGCRCVEDLEQMQRAEVAKMRTRFGREARVREVDEPIEARINWGRWIVDCNGPGLEDGCNNGPAVETETGTAHCMECGAVYTNVVLPEPEERREIEELLLARPFKFRNWEPPYTADDVRAVNVSRGIGRRRDS